jgi:DNA-binding LacI/PurR family transcriptional regulator/anti-anti-sigma regulatory factor
VRDSIETDEKRHIKLQSARPTIGLLTSETDDPISWALWMGVNRVAQEQDINLVCFVGGALHSPETGRANVLYDLVGPEILDGLVVAGGGLAQFTDLDEVQTLCERYRPLLMVNVALPLVGIPSVLVDNYSGMHDAVVHLVEVHGFRRIAFVRGPEGHPEAEERYRAYADVLAEYGLPLNMDLIAPGEFSESSGTEAVSLFLDERKLQPQTDFEAVVAVDDVTAIGAMEALQARGIRVPGDVAVVGFDDAEEAERVIPTLTTVRQPIYQQGRQAVEMLLALLAGEQVSEGVKLPTELVVRRSCGCLPLSASQATVGLVTRTGQAFELAFAVQRDKVLSEMVQAMGDSATSSTLDQVRQLFDAFSAESKGDSPGIFLSTLDEVLFRGLMMGSDVASWQAAISVLRRHAVPYFADQKALSQAEDLWHQGRVVIQEAVQWAQAHQKLQTERRTTLLREIGQTLLTVSGVIELADEVARELPQLGIPSCYLSLYKGREQSPGSVEGIRFGRSKLILAYGKEGRVELESGGRHFPSHLLVPEGMLSRKRRYTMMVESFYFGEGQLGFGLFGVGPQDGALYEVLRGQLSTALHGALLLQERERAEAALERAYAEVEKQVEERTAQLQREIAERERLQREIIDAQKQMIQELSTPIIPIMERIIVVPLVGNIDAMRARGIMRALLTGIREHRAKVVILDITGVSVVDSNVADHLNKTVQAARLKGARTIVSGVSDAVAETIVDLGIDWAGIETLSDLRTGLRAVLQIPSGRGRSVSR